MLPKSEDYVSKVVFCPDALVVSGASPVAQNTMMTKNMLEITKQNRLKEEPKCKIISCCLLHAN